MQVQQKDIPTVQLSEEEIGTLPTLKLGEKPVDGPTKKRRRYGWVELVLSAAVLMLAFVLLLLVYADLQNFYRVTLKPGVIRYWPNALAVVALLVIGYNLYVFRGYRRLWFGICETLLAAGLGWYAVNKAVAVAGDGRDAIVIAIAALYLAGRGFVNISYRFRPFQVPDQDQR